MARSGYYHSLIVKPTVIIAPGKYQTRSGETVTIDTVSACHLDGCTGTYSNGIPETWHESGRIFTGTETQNDIISPVQS